MTVGNLAFCLALYLTGVHFQGELQHVGHVCKQKIKCQPIKTRKMAGVRLQDELYAKDPNKAIPRRTSTRYLNTTGQIVIIIFVIIITIFFLSVTRRILTRTKCLDYLIKNFKTFIARHLCKLKLKGQKDFNQFFNL